jgi:hypothetical protein
MSERYLPPGMEHASQAYETLADHCMYRLSGAQWKVLTFVARRTIGFGKQTDAISLSQICRGITTRDGRRLDYGTGLSRQATVEALRGLEAKSLLTVTHGGSKTNTYAVNWQAILADCQKQTSPESRLPGSPESRPKVVKKVDIQLAGDSQSYKSQDSDQDCPTNGKSSRSSRRVSLPPSKPKQYPGLKKLLAQYMRGQVPSDRQVVEVVEATGGAPEENIYAALVYLNNERGLCYGTESGPEYFAWFPRVLREYFEKKRHHEEQANPAPDDVWDKDGTRLPKS